MFRDVLSNTLSGLPHSLLTVNIPDSEGDLFSQLLLVELHPDYFVGEPLVEESVYLRSSTELHRVDCSTAAALYGPLEVLLKLLDHL